MQKRLELAKDFSCLNRAGAEEPIFVLRAKDEVGAATVRLWAAAAVGVHEPEKIEEALQLANEMEQWRNGTIPQCVSPVPTGYAVPAAIARR